MLRFLKSKIPASHHEARQRERDEFFAFEKTLHYGFPAKPSCVAHDPELNLLAIGTGKGLIYILGAPGVEFVGSQPNATPVINIFFIPNEGRVITLCEDQSLHLWEVNFREGKSFLDHVTSCSTEDRLKKISASALQSPLVDGGVYSLLIGTESGNVYSLDTKTFELTDYIIYQDVIIQNIPDDFKVNPGAVESIAVHPTDAAQILLGYNRGLIVLWDATAAEAKVTFVSQQGVQTVSWQSDGCKLVAGHNDGSYVVWSVDDGAKPLQSPNIPFGPFPCKPIDRIITVAGDDDFLIFTGGMPRASFGDRHTVAVQKKGKEVVLDLSSKIVDVICIYDNTLVILCEEELVGVDLEADGWPVFRLPYLHPLHASPITACQHITPVSESFIAQLRELSTGDGAVYSNREWPVKGGSVLESANAPVKELLVTGHEDGSVKLWLVHGASLELMHILRTARIFHGYTDPNANADTEDWPPFAKVGLYDPYTDDPRYSVQRVQLNVVNSQLLVGGTAGQVLLYNFSDKEVNAEVNTTDIDIVADKEGFVWKGEPKLAVKEGNISQPAGFVVNKVVQMIPPASVTALAINDTWNILAVGTGHGFAVFDTVRNETVMAKCLLNPNDLVSQVVNAAAEGTQSRFKSFKKSLRQSFRKRRRGQDESPEKKSAEPAAEIAAEETGTSSPKPEDISPANTGGGGESSTAAAVVASPKKSPKKESPKKESPKKESPKKKAVEDKDDDIKPVERAVEARGENKEHVGLTSLVRALYFVKTFLVDGETESCTLWVGTNGGEIHIHLLTIAEGEKRTEETVTCTLAKEIRLMHAAPVLHITVVDSKGVDVNSAATSEGGHRAVIVSEEQIKTFHLPSLKPGRHKYKLTAIEGTRVRKAQLVNVHSVTDPSRVEPFIVLMTNSGEVQALAVQTLKRYLHTDCISKQDITAILSTVLSTSGDGFHLSSSSEWQRFAIVANNVVRNNCSIELPEGARPALQVKPHNQQNNEDTLPEEEPKPEAALDKSVVCGIADTTVESHNSTLPTDVTLDSIRDYTQNEETVTEVVDGVTTVTKVIKTTKTIVTEDGEKTETTTETQQLVNGEAEEELAKLKALKIEHSDSVVETA